MRMSASTHTDSQAGAPTYLPIGGEVLLPFGAAQLAAVTEETPHCRMDTAQHLRP
jgi:hypothetical protein